MTQCGNLPTTNRNHSILFIYSFNLIGARHDANTSHFETVSSTCCCCYLPSSKSDDFYLFILFEERVCLLLRLSICPYCQTKRNALSAHNQSYVKFVWWNQNQNDDDKSDEKTEWTKTNLSFALFNVRCFCCRLPIILEYSVAQSGVECVSAILIRDTSSGDCFVVVISFTRTTFYLIFNTVNMWLFLSRAVVCYIVFIPFFFCFE